MPLRSQTLDEKALNAVHEMPLVVSLSQRR